MFENGVSIICNTYNHSKYLKDAFNGFLQQKTLFPIEVLVHDDASTDGTKDIIQQYVQEYPDIFKPVYQVENQYSKGVQIGRQFQYKRAMFKYCTTCEGDDYWIDSNKLQKQVEIMEENKAVDICAHAHKSVDSITGEILSHKQIRDSTCIISARDVILGGGGFVATASLLFRTSILYNELPFRKILDLDYTLQVQGALRGGMIYLPEEMCVYRTNNAQSWAERVKRNQVEMNNHLDAIYAILKQLDIDTNSKYHNDIKKLIYKNRFKRIKGGIKSYINVLE